MLFLQYPPCSTCQKAKKWLDDHGIEYTARHIKEGNPTADELREWVARSGLPLKRFFNPSGLVYKNLGLKENVIIGKLIPAGTGLPEVEEELVQAEIARDAAEAAYDH